MTEESREELRKTLTQTDRPDAGKNASGDVDVTGIIDEYADLPDTMIAGKMQKDGLIKTKKRHFSLLLPFSSSDSVSRKDVRV